MISVLDRNNFGKIVLCKKNDTKVFFAIKQIRKDLVIETNETELIKNEKKILELIDHPFLAKLFYAFETEKKIYFVMKFIKGGDLGFYLK